MLSAATPARRIDLCDSRGCRCSQAGYGGNVLDSLKKLLRRKPPVVAPPEVLAQGGLTFGFSTWPQGGGWTVEAYGPDGRRRGRVLRGVTHEQQATLTLAGAQAAELDQSLALSGVWEEACRLHRDNAAVIDHMAEEMTRINGRDPRL